MIGRKSPGKSAVEPEKPQGFDDYAVRLGDLMRGERATLGKSLLDVQRELRIKASYIAAIENCDPAAFDTPGFIAGYVRSYARYLGLNPEETFAIFCAESGFSTAHGMSEKASTIRKANGADQPKPRARDPLAEPAMAFAPARDSMFSRVEPGAIGSVLVLLTLIGGIGYGGLSVLKEVQRVQISPIEQTPVVLSDLDPLSGAVQPVAAIVAPTETNVAAGVFTPPTSEAFDRLYRPQALDVPVLVARDAPISTLDPESVGVFAEMGSAGLPQVQDSSLAALALTDGSLLQPRAVSNGVMVVSVRPAWVRVRDEEGGTLFTGIMNAGDTFDVPADAVNPHIEVGESGAVYFAVNGTVFGPAGPRGSVSDVPLKPETLTARYSPIEAGSDNDLVSVMAELDLKRPTEQGSEAFASVTMPKVLADSTPGVTIVVSREAWVRVKAPSGATVFESIMKPGQTYNVPRTAEAATIRTGDAGAVFFAVNGKTYGPYGGNGQIADKMALSVEAVTEKLALADPEANVQLAKVVAELSAAQAQVASE